MDNNISFVEQNFIDWCKHIHPDINPYIFIERYNRYTKKYPPLIREVLRNIYNEIHTKKPNITFSLKGRYKAKRSFFIKTVKTMAENIDVIFSIHTDEETRKNAIEKYFSFYKKTQKNINNPNYINSFNELENLILEITSNPENKDIVENFKKVFDKMPKQYQTILIARLGRTEDTFAYRPIIHSVDFTITAIQNSKDGTIEFLDENGNIVPISLSTSINPDEDIIKNENGLRYVIINGKKQKLNERNLLYDSSISSKNRNLRNAQKDNDGNITILGDSILLPNDEILDISTVDFNKTKNAFFVTDVNGESRNLSKLLQSGSIKIRKYDEDTIIKSIYEVNNIIENYYASNNIQSISGKDKDYIANPKPLTKYMSLHKSAFHREDKYNLESQIRSIEMEDEAKDESEIRGHDAYKLAKLEEYGGNQILAKILSIDETALDSSTQTLIKVLENPKVDLSDILGKYLLITTTQDGIITDYSPDDDFIFEHLFEHNSYKNSNKLKFDYSSYKNFMRSRDNAEKINDDMKFPDIYDE